MARREAACLQRIRIRKESQVRNDLLETLIRADVPILGFDTGGGRLEDVFLRLTAEAIR